MCTFWVSIFLNDLLRITTILLLKLVYLNFESNVYFSPQNVLFSSNSAWTHLSLIICLKLSYDRTNETLKKHLLYSLAINFQRHLPKKIRNIKELGMDKFPSGGDIKTITTANHISMKESNQYKISNICLVPSQLPSHRSMLWGSSCLYPLNFSLTITCYISLSKYPCSQSVTP